MKIEIVNLVATATLGEPIHLEYLTPLSFIIYTPSRSFCAYFKDETMAAKVFIFTSGKLIMAVKDDQEYIAHEYED